jgi:hypothetical protein
MIQMFKDELKAAHLATKTARKAQERLDQEAKKIAAVSHVSTLLNLANCLIINWCMYRGSATRTLPQRRSWRCAGRRRR